MRIRSTRGLPLMVPFLGVWLSGCGADAPLEVEPRPINLVAVEAWGEGETLTLPGTVRAARAAMLSFGVPGRIEGIARREGERVEAGELLAWLENADYRNAVSEANAALEEAKIAAAQAESDYHRARRLYTDGHWSAQHFGQARTAWMLSETRIERATQHLQVQERRLTDAELRAERSGVITGLRVEVGERVPAGAPVLELAVDGPPRVEAWVTGSDASRLEPGDSATVHVPQADLGPIPGRVLEVGRVGDGRTGLYLVRLELPSVPLQAWHRPEEGVLPGMAARVNLTRRSLGETAVVLPLEALVAGPAGAYVLRFEPIGSDPVWRQEGVGSSVAGVLQRVPVDVRDIGPRGARVEGTISPGSLVASPAAPHLVPGQEVRGLRIRSDR